MIEVTESEIEEENKYPWLGVGSDGMVVLFHDYGSGTCLKAGEYREKGHYTKEWDMSFFTDYDKAITLSNK